jgi:sterigmatocystin biosynthesis cytochrome P450 monooxygenase
MPPWSPIFGHLLFARWKLAWYPSDAIDFVVLKDIFKDHFQMEEMFYLDLWPVMARPLLVVCNAPASTEVDRKLTEKPAFYRAQFDAQSGGPQLLSSNGDLWKAWEKLMYPGFAQKFLLSRVVDVVDNVEIFCDKLKEKARDDQLVLLEELISPLVIDSLLKIGL